MERIEALLRTRTGLVFPPSRRTLLDSGVRAAMEAVGSTDAEVYAAALVEDDAALQALADRVTIKETYFFREPGQFELLRQRILPELTRHAVQPLRIWSAGCATGEEAWSLAMVLAEAGQPEAVVLGTDISETALEKARQARYGSWSLRGDHQPALRHGSGEAQAFEVDRALRPRVAFRRLNLMEGPDAWQRAGVPSCHLIVCRNVLIYLAPEAIRALVEGFWESLLPGGWLVCGPSDPLLLPLASFETVQTEAGLAYRRSDPALPDVPPHPLLQTGPVELPPPPPEATPAVPPLARVRERADREGAQAAEPMCRALLDQNAHDGDLHHLHALLLLELGRLKEAEAAARKGLFLLRRSPVLHYTLASILLRQHDRRGAWRSFRNARDLALAWPAGEPLPLAEGEPPQQLAAAAANWMRTLDEHTGA